ncbi:hypothetical protein CBR_g45818 [Chara braunii]|uniref:Uncharacterized protein n=1 Tax=Chara braunii TaxID=69332 RepID=A0A388LZB3_CHABU|nr:hypothetical protein CBR_g45818 [Chara braunii]|eukprot:GBG87664.1 hypothetical protein CBR_g45818 [Chara braunii]
MDQSTQANGYPPHPSAPPQPPPPPPVPTYPPYPPYQPFAPYGQPYWGQPPFPTVQPGLTGGGYENGYGNGYGYNNGNWRGNNPNRAFFTKDQADFLEKLKFKEAVQEAAKQQTGDKQTSNRNAETGLKIVEIGARKVEDKEEVMKNRVTKTFGGSLKLLSTKLEKVDRKSKLAEEEKEELRRLRAEKELQELKEASSNEKRKRLPTTPTTSPKVERVRDDGAKLIKKGRGNLTSKFEDAKGKGKEKVTDDMTEIKDLLKQLVTSLGQTKMNAATTDPAQEGMSRDEKGECSKKGDDRTEEGKDQTEGEVFTDDRDELGLAGYMKNRVENYSSMHYTHIMALCKERNIEYTRKGLRVMELPRLDLEEYMRCLREIEENGAKVVMSEDNAPSNNKEQDIQGN